MRALYAFSWLMAIFAPSITLAALQIERMRGDPLKPRFEQAHLVHEEAVERLMDLETRHQQLLEHRQALIFEHQEAQTELAAIELEIVTWTNTEPGSATQLRELDARIASLKSSLTKPLAELALARAQGSDEVTIFRLEAIAQTLIARLAEAQSESSGVRRTLVVGDERFRLAKSRQEHLNETSTELATLLANIDDDLAALALDLDMWRQLTAERREDLAFLNNLMDALAAEAGLSLETPPHRLNEVIAVRAPFIWPFQHEYPSVGSVQRDTASVMPISGKLVASFGERMTAPLDKGVLFEAAGGSRIVAPKSGKVVFAGPFQRYGQLLIIDHGDGYHTLLAGFDWLGVNEGNNVEAGQLVGSLAGDKQDNSRLYLELRKRGKPTNPLPWLAAQADKVRG